MKEQPLYGSSDTYFQRTEYTQGGSNRRERKHFQPERYSTRKRFDDYCTEEKIQNLQITTCVPRGGEYYVENPPNSNPCLTKLSIDDPTKWHKRRPTSKNSKAPPTEVPKWSPFELLTGVTMRNKEDLYLRNT
ncbi:pro-Pol polyprotein [Trichonephila clavipes]|nr:pro-Pol polyprotein [Trichonephila clavipes]